MQVPWMRPGSSFTLLIDAFIVALCWEMPMTAVARLLGTTRDCIALVLDHHVAQVPTDAKR